MGNMEEEIDVTVADRMFDRGGEEYNHILMDLQRLSLGRPLMETGNFATFSQGEENEAHLELDEILKPRMMSYPTRSTVRVYDDDQSLMEWVEEEEPVRLLKRKRESRKNIRKVQHEPPVPVAKTKNKRRGKYLLVGTTVNKFSIDHPRMAMLNERILKAALVIRERSITRAEEQKLKHIKQHQSLNSRTK